MIGRLVRVLVPLLAGAVLAACDDRGHRVVCTCTFLTDFDDSSSRDVTVCAPTADRAPNVARGCAQSAAPAPVQRCTCKPEIGAPCTLGECTQMNR
jgi:hypothetical protein